MDLAIVTTLTLIPFELMVSISLVLEGLMTDLIDFGDTTLLMRHKTISIWSPLNCINGEFFMKLGNIERLQISAKRTNEKSNVLQ